MGRIIGVLALLLVLYAIITQPVTSAAMVRSVGSTLGAAATNTAQFVYSVTTGSSSAAASTSLSSTSSSTHTVRPGETLSGIAAANGTTAGSLAAQNGLSNPNHIVPGQQLSVR
jgi:LysM repeat protein